MSRPPAGWQSGYAEDCKSSYSGSIPLPASIQKLNKIGIFGRLGRPFHEQIWLQGASTKTADSLRASGCSQELRATRMQHGWVLMLNFRSGISHRFARCNASGMDMAALSCAIIT
jgi:hypothetical protein